MEIVWSEDKNPAFGWTDYTSNVYLHPRVEDRSVGYRGDPEYGQPRWKHQPSHGEAYTSDLDTAKAEACRGALAYMEQIRWPLIRQVFAEEARHAREGLSDQNPGTLLLGVLSRMERALSLPEQGRMTEILSCRVEVGRIAYAHPHCGEALDKVRNLCWSDLYLRGVL